MSSAEKFKQFVKRQQRAASEETQPDWAKEKSDWIHYLNKLYGDVRDYLSEYIDDGAVILTKKSKRLDEENIGAYDVDALFIKIGLREVHLDPIGTLIIGSKGRVDVRGSAGNARLVLVNKSFSTPHDVVKVSVRHELEIPPHTKQMKNIEWAWKIVTSPPAMKFIELNKESFLQLLLEVSNG